ncbi:acyltransferase domain-containing protein [Streptomyces sp. NPDC093808]|uniref:acyltransferase domain-containing protein n=1 Tax=unclassified Streptomyces TaxID=2593676 RepID=UPI003450FA26
MKLDTPARGLSRPTLLECCTPGAAGPGPSAATETAVLFTGADAPSPALTRSLYGTFPAFRTAFDALCRSFDDRLPVPLVAVVFAPEQGADARLLGEAPYVRCALFGYQVALFRLWESWGLDAAAVAGRGSGLVAAAHVAGGLGAREAARLLAAEPARQEERHRCALAAGEASRPPYGEPHGSEPHGTEGYGTVLACGPVSGTGTTVGDVRALARALAALQLHGPPLDWERMAGGAGPRPAAPAP